MAIWTIHTSIDLLHNPNLRHKPHPALNQLDNMILHRGHNRPLLLLDRQLSCLLSYLLVLQALSRHHLHHCCRQRIMLHKMNQATTKARILARAMTMKRTRTRSQMRMEGRIRTKSRRRTKSSIGTKSWIRTEGWMRTDSRTKTRCGVRRFKFRAVAAPMGESPMRH